MSTMAPSAMARTPLRRSVVRRSLRKITAMAVPNNENGGGIFHLAVAL
jgi:hypothetical protein